MFKIFISYRRDDSSGYAGRLFDLLSARFGRDSVFMDLDAIRAGDDFAQAIEAGIGHCDVLLAMIGERWLTSSLEDGRRRLELADDFVRLEISNAFELGVRVIPVLVGKAGMPPRADLPEDLRPLCGRQAMELRDAHFREDSERLVTELLLTVPRIAGGAWKGRWRWIASASAVLLVGVLWGGVVFSRRGAAVLPSRGEPAPSQVKSNSGAELRTPNTRPTVSQLTEGKRGETGKPANREAGPTAEIAGKWKATLSYDWPNGTYTETFNFNSAGSQVSGTASLLEMDRVILSGKLEKDRISFMTKTAAIGDDKSAEDRHLYRGVVEGDTIRFTLTTDSDHDSHLPVHFTATRVAAK